MRTTRTVAPCCFGSHHCQPPEANRPLSRDAFSKVVEPLFPQLRRVARRIVRSDDLAEDALQEALLALWERDEWPPNPAGWLARAVAFRSLHLQRSRRRRRAHEERAALHRPESISPSTVLDSADAAGLAARLSQYLESLAPPFRAAFVLREVDHLDYQAIAQRLAVPVGTVRSRLNRSRRTLRQLAEQAGSRF